MCKYNKYFYNIHNLTQTPAFLYNANLCITSKVDFRVKQINWYYN